MAALEVENVSFNYSGTNALSGVTFTAGPGVTAVRLAGKDVACGISDTAAKAARRWVGEYRAWEAMRTAPANPP
jgi:hypothetical protein